jgi:DNA repair protein RecN (Recombination protein N)
MLIELAIRNFAIMDEVNIKFGPGLNALTGETGAGKSILIDALGAVLGDRISSDVVRTGARSAFIDATFDVSNLVDRPGFMATLNELQVDVDDGVLILGREIQSGGRSSARLNGRPTTASVLTQIGHLLVDIHGQSEHLSLLRASTQLDMLDRYAQIIDERGRFATRLESLRQTRAALAQAIAGARERMQRVDLLRFQIDEISGAALLPGEEEELVAERARLANADRLLQDAAAAYVALTGGDDDFQGGAMPSLRQAAQILETIASIDPASQPLKEKVKELVFLLEDAEAEVRSYRDEIEADPARLAVVEERIDALRNLKRKYGADLAEVQAYCQAAEKELEFLTSSEVDAESLASQNDLLSLEIGELAARLSEKRRAAAKVLASEVNCVTSELNMGAASLVVSLEQSGDDEGVPVPSNGNTATRLAVTSTGIDRATFLVATNQGETPKPLARIASGGETARLMLAMKSILSTVDQTPTLVFDEIDVGVGGRSGQVVGEKLWHLAQNHQVIVITHLPQIAAFADSHYRIEKHELAGRSVSTIQELGDTERVEELAAMLDGIPLTKSAVQNARQMRERATAAKGLHVGAA